MGVDPLKCWAEVPRTNTTVVLPHDQVGKTDSLCGLVAGGSAVEESK